MFPPCWRLSTGAYSGVMADSGRAHANGYFPELLLPVSLSSRSLSLLPPASAGDPPTLTGRSVSVSYGVTAPFPWVLVHTLLCVCPASMESLLPPVLLKSCNQIPLAFKVQFSGDSCSHCQTPSLGSLMWGSEPSLQWVDFCGIIVLQLDSPTQRLWDLIFHDCTPPTISLQLLLCLWMWGIFFGEF